MAKKAVKEIQSTLSPATTAITPSVTPTTVKRRLRLPPLRLRLKRIKHPEKLPTAWWLLRAALRTIVTYKLLFIGIMAVYLLLSLVLVHGLSAGQDAVALKQQSGYGKNIGGELGSGLFVFVSLLSPSTTDASSGAAGAYQLFIGVIVSLATIWALRQVSAGQRVTIKNAFYGGMTPLVPFMLVLFIAVLQLLPLIIGGMLYAFVVGKGLAVGALETAIFTALFALLSFVSLYFTCSSLFALYIVTLPDMQPRKALRSAGQLVRYRRAAIFRRLLFLPVILLFAAAVIIVLCVAVFAPAAPWLLFVLSMAGLVVVHTYLYQLYKALLA